MNYEQKKKVRLSSAAGVALVIGIVAMLNVLSAYLYGRLDFSRGQVYSVSRASRRIIGALPDPVNITVYYSKELPPQYAVVKNYLRDLLKEYSSGGKVRMRLVEIGDDAKARDEAMRAGVAPVRFDIFSNEKFEQREGFLGFSIQYQDKKDVVAFLKDTSGLEYDLTSRIKMLASSSKPVIGFVSSPAALGTGSIEQSIAGQLRTRYDLRDVQVSTASAEISADIGALLVAGPTAKFSDSAINALEQYLASGRSLCVLLNTKRVDPRVFSAFPLDTGLQPFLSRHGVNVLDTIVSDLQSQVVQIQVPQGPFMMTNITQYPPLVVSNDLSQSNPITKGFDSLTIPFASPIEISNSPGMTYDVLARSSKMSWAPPPGSSGQMNFNPFSYPKRGPQDLSGPFNLAVAVTGDKKAGRLVVIGTSKLVESEFRAPEANGLFMMNLADWLSQDEDLIAIRSKDVKFHPLREISPVSKKLVRYLNLFLPPLLAVGLGLWRWRSRASRRERHLAEFAAAAPPVTV